MPFDEQNIGDPFPGEFPGREGHEPWDNVEAVVERQVVELAQRPYEPAARHELLRSLQRRRQRRPEPGAQQARPPQPEPNPPQAEPGAQPPGEREQEPYSQQQGPGAQRWERRPARPRVHPIAQFSYLPVEVGFDNLLGSGELLITGQSYDGRYAPVPGWGPDRYAKGYLDELGVHADDVEECLELHDRVLRLTHPDMGPQELADVARVLRLRGFSASVTNITPTAPVSKGIGGPQPAPSAPGDFHPDLEGRRAKVAIIDTGITAEYRTDGWLEDINDISDIDPLDEFPLPGGDGFLDLAAGHGTFVAGIVQQVAPGASIKIYRAVDSDGIASEVTVACEMIRAAMDGAEIINLSLGCQTLDDVPPIAIEAALEIIRESGRDVLYVAAAGNYGDMRFCWPAAFPGVVSVAALAPDMLPSQWSTRGSWVTCSTIGQGVRSTFVEGKESPLVAPPPRTFGRNAWAYWSGTSFAAPQITGALARLHQDLGIPLREALRRLLAAGLPIPQFGQALKILPGI